MPTLIERLFRNQIQTAVLNQFNKAFYSTVGGGATPYESNPTTYLEKGLLSNPIVSSIIYQRIDKAKQIPFYIKRVEDKTAQKELNQLNLSTKHLPKQNQIFKRKALEKKAYSEDIKFPLERPNPLQTWAEIISLYEMFITLTGNFYLYVLKGEISGEPLAVYVLPAHMMEIVVKQGASTLGLETPIDYYRLIEGNTAIRFDAEEIIHIKLPNPIYNQNGSHLYGLSRLRAALRNVQTTNLGLDLNTDAMLNGGAFGFIHGMDNTLTEPQAQGVKDRLVEMRNSKDALGKIAGASARLGFTQIRLSASEMELFKYFEFDQKMICNALGWDDKLLNNDSGAKYDNMELAEQRVVVNTIMPSLQLFGEAMTDRFLPMFKAYDNTCFIHDPSELPEMQSDISEMITWIEKSIQNGVITRNEAREFLRLPIEYAQEMNLITVNVDVMTLKEAVNEFTILPPEVA